MELYRASGAAILSLGYASLTLLAERHDRERFPFTKQAFRILIIPAVVLGGFLGAVVYRL